MSAQTNPKSVLAFSASYEITPDVSVSDMATDAGCILDSLIATVNTIAIELGDEGGQMQANPAVVGKILWGVMFQLQVVNGLVESIERKTVQALRNSVEKVVQS